MAVVLALSAQAQSTRVIDMYVGDVRVMQMADVVQVAVGNEDVVKYKPMDDGEFLVIAGSPGESKLHIWQRGSRRQTVQINVYAHNPSKSLELAQTAVQGIPGLKVRSHEDKLIFEGVISQAHSKTFEDLLSHFEHPVNLVRYRDFDVKPLVRLDVKILEIRKRALSQLGVRWHQVASGPAIGIHKSFSKRNPFRIYSEDPNGNDLEGLISSVPTDRGLYGYAGITSALGSRIDLLAENGDAAVIAAPKLSAKSGEAANFVSGGEFPIPIVDNDGRTIVEFKKYGVLLDIIPEVDADGNINTYVSTELSAIDFANQVNDIPGLTTRSSETTVNMASGDTLVISGLASAEFSEQVAKLPVLGDLPLLGNLFKSKDKNFDASELVIMVTPHIVEVASDLNQKLVERGNEIQSRFDKYEIDARLME